MMVIHREMRSNYYHKPQVLGSNTPSPWGGIGEGGQSSGGDSGSRFRFQYSSYDGGLHNFPLVSPPLYVAK
jgi:hypothetical protein